MELHGLHHVTAVTGQAQANVDFYTQVLGMRLVKKQLIRMMCPLTIFFTGMSWVILVPN